MREVEKKCEEDCDPEQYFFNGVEWECPNCDRTWDDDDLVIDEEE
ncbi:MAG: hypothetical protein ABI199_04415 [Bacteroidia bacterium]